MRGKEEERRGRIAKMEQRMREGRGEEIEKRGREKKNLNSDDQSPTAASLITTLVKWKGW
jgi:hypothetical protein